jgi:4-cresol dehydrogenase (hydroxylating)
VVLDERRLKLGWAVAHVCSRFGWDLLARWMAKVQVAFDLLRGKPSHESLDGARWRVPPGPASSNAASSDPLDHNAGLLWLSPVLPMTRAHVDRVNALARPCFDRHGFEYQVTLSAVTARALCAVMTVCYNKADADETRRAASCYDEALDTLMAAGYIPYRVGNRSMGRIGAGSDVFWDVAAALKQALDPVGVIAPGHYAPAASRFISFHPHPPRPGE